MILMKERKAVCLGLALAVAVSTAPVSMAETYTSGVTSTYDEAYYGITDYYGNLTEGSVVKTYVMNGVDSITDYGNYTAVNNLTNDIEGSYSNGVTKFTFDKDNVPDRFYFEGETTEPFDQLPWKCSVQYKLNGVNADAEDLAGASGLVEIDLNIVPNEDASEYAKNNYTLEATAMFNQSDILSLEQEGGQVQLIGNLRTVLFMALPGEEQHFKLWVGADSFEFSGFTFIFAPATLSQLDKIADLQEKKDDLEDDYNKLIDSFDETLDAMAAMTDSLNNSAVGLDELNAARNTISNGKSKIYDDADDTNAELKDLADQIEPLEMDLGNAAAALTETKIATKQMITDLDGAKDELQEISTLLKKISKDTGSVKTLIQHTQQLEKYLDDLSTAVGGIDYISYNSVDGVSDAQVVKAIAESQGSSLTTDQANALVTLFNKGVDLTGTGTYIPLTSLTEPYRTIVANNCGMTWDTLMAFYEAYLEKKAEAGTTNDMISDLNSTVYDLTDTVNDTITSVKTPTKQLLAKLADICGELDAVNDLLDDTQNISEVSDDLIERINTLIDDTDAVYEAIDNYEPKLQNTITDLQNLSITTAVSLRSLSSLLSDTESLAKSSGTELDQGTKDALEGLADTLRRTADAMATSKNLKQAKNDLDSIIRDIWDDHTGEYDNLLNMDNTLDAVSLTSAMNPAPTSIQVIIRTAEIKIDKQEANEKAAQELENSTFWSRVAQMFKDIGAAIKNAFS